MGLFLTDSDPSELIDQIRKFANKENFDSISEERGKGRFGIRAQGLAGKKHVESQWVIDEYDDKASIRMEVHPDKKWKTKIILKTLALLCSFVATVIFFDLYFLSARLSNPKYLSVLIVLVFIVSSFLFLRDDRRYKKILRKMEGKFRTFLGEQVKIRIKSPVQSDFLPAWLHIVFSMVYASCLLYLSFRILLIIFIFFLVLTVLYFLNLALQKLGNMHSLFLWKRILLDNVLKWVLVNLSVLALAVLLFSASLVEFFQNEKNVNRNIMNIKQASFSREFIEYLNRQLEDPIKSRIKNTKDISDAKYEEWLTDEKERDVYLKISSFISFLTGAIVIIGSLALFAYFLVMLLKIPEDWKLTMAESTFLPIKPPSLLPGSVSSFVLFRTITFIWFITAMAINLCSALVSIEIISCFISGKTILLKESAAVISSIPASFSMLSVSFNLGIVPLLNTFAKTAILVFALPFLYFLLRLISNIFTGTIKKVIKSLINKDKAPLGIRAFILETAQENNIKAPGIRMSTSKGTFIQSKIGFFSSRATIEINNNIYDVLNEKEIQAVISHELGHIKQGLRKIALLKFLSRIAMFPNFFLTILLDFRRMEDEADKFAIIVTGNREALKSALEKLATAKLVDKMTALQGKERRGSKLPGWIKIVKKKFLILDDFLFGEALVGYSHPSILERIKAMGKE